MSQFNQQTLDSGVVVIKPEGRLNMVAAPTLRKELQALVEGGSKHVVVDLRGRWLVTGSNTTRLWHLNIEDLIEYAAYVAGRELTLEEKEQYLRMERY